MDKRPDIEKKVEKALESLNNIKRAEPQPFFYTRLIGRLQNDQQNIWELAGSFLARPAVAVVGLCLILLFNVGILVQKEMSGSNTSTNFSQQITADEEENIFAANTTYDYENLDEE